MTDLEIIMAAGNSKKQAERYLKDGATVFTEKEYADYVAEMLRTDKTFTAEDFVPFGTFDNYHKPISVNGVDYMIEYVL